MQDRHQPQVGRAQALLQRPPPGGQRHGAGVRPVRRMCQASSTPIQARERAMARWETREAPSSSAGAGRRQYASEHYAVYASSTGNDASNFANALLEEVLTAKTVVTAPETIRSKIGRAHV